MKSTNEQRTENFLKHLKREDSFGPNYSAETRFEVGAEWMRSSIENARASLDPQDFQIKGFRPGKAPKHLIEKRQGERARELAAAWVLADLRTLLETDPDLLILSEISRGDAAGWSGGEEPLTVRFSYRAWRYPNLDIDALADYTAAPSRANSSETLETHVVEFLSSTVIPAGIEDILLETGPLSPLRDTEGGIARLHVRRAIANNIVARSLGVTVEESDLEKAYGEIAIADSKSLVEVKDEIEPDLDIFMQRVESDKAYTALEGLLAERRGGAKSPAVNG